MEDDQHMRRCRPYYWGAIYISDADCQEEFDIDFHGGEGPVLSSASHAAVVVAHAGAVVEGEADVILDLWVKDQRVDGLPYEVALEVPSGRLYVGDADGDDELALRPGRWLLQFAVDDQEEARRVEIVVSPL